MRYRVSAVIDAVNLAPLIEALVPLSGKPLQVSAYTGEKPERAITRTPPAASLDDLLEPAPAHANYDPPPAPAPAPRAPAPAPAKRPYRLTGVSAPDTILGLLKAGPATTRELRELLHEAGYARTTFDTRLWDLLKEGKVELVPDAPERTVRLKG